METYVFVLLSEISGSSLAALSKYSYEPYEKRILQVQRENQDV